MKNEIAKINSNPIGALVGAVAFYFGVKKFSDVSNTFVLLGITALGAYVGASIQSEYDKKEISSTRMDSVVNPVKPTK